MENKSENKQGITQEKDKSRVILGGSVGVLIVLVMLLQIITKMTELNAIAQPAPQLPSSISQSNTVKSNQQQMGDDFYKAASGGAAIPQQSRSASSQQKTATTQAKPAAATAPAAKKPSTNAKTQAKAAATKEANKGDALVTVNLKQNVGRAHPFVPSVSVSHYSTLGSSSLPQLPKASYPAPPTELIENPTAENLMQTTISGIMYEAFSPSAIINVEGQDHLVRKGDRINGYKVLDITKNRVIVQNGTNIYRATVGEVLTTQNDVHFNNVYNLQSKFAGASADEGTKMIEIN